MTSALATVEPPGRYPCPAECLSGRDGSGICATCGGRGSVDQPPPREAGRADVDAVIEIGLFVGSFLTGVLGGILGGSQQRAARGVALARADERRLAKQRQRAAKEKRGRRASKKKRPAP